MWLHLIQAFLHVSMAAGCRRENVLVWVTIDLMTLAMLGLVRRSGPLSTRGCGNKNVCFSTFWCVGGGGGGQGGMRRRGHWHRTAEYEQCAHMYRTTGHQTSVRHNIEWYSGPGSIK